MKMGMEHVSTDSRRENEWKIIFIFNSKKVSLSLLLSSLLGAIKMLKKVFARSEFVESEEKSV
jgi:hypothetical protein